MNSLAGTSRLIRLVLRRDRLRLTVWVLVLAMTPIATASALAGLFPTAAEREQLAVTVASTPALIAFLGPVYDSSIGGLTAWRVGTIGATLAGIMAVLTMIRHTREDEEAGRRELLGATVVGRSAPLAAVGLIVLSSGALIGLIVALGFVGLGESMTGAMTYGLGVFAVVAVFASVGALSAQLTESAATARGLGVGAVAGSFILRVVGDAGEGAGLSWISWLSPIGWFSRLQPFADNQIWVLALSVGLTAVVGGLAFRIMARRDIGAGVFVPRPGPERGAPSLRRPSGLAWRLHRGSALGWTLGLALMAVVFGAIGDSVAQMLADNPQLAAFFEALGGEQGITDAFFSTAIGILALLAAAYSIRAVLRMRVEEDESRVEPILATSTPRFRWAMSHVVFGLLVPMVMLVLAGLVIGTVYGLITGDLAGQAFRAVGGGMIQLPAVWVLTGLAVALFGLAPRFVSLSWGVLVAVLLVGQLGQILEFPQWALNLSPFTHIPVLPSEDVEPVPLLALGGLGIALTWAGLWGIRTRDFPTV